MATTATWFKMFLSFAPMINAVPSVNVGEGVKAAMNYFKSGIEPEGLEPMSIAVYETLKDSIDQAFADCDRKTANAQKANAVRWGNVQHGSNMDPTWIETDPEESQSQNKSQNKNKRQIRRDKERESVAASVSVSSMSGGTDFDADAAARAISNFLYLHGIRISVDEVADMLNDGFDSDVIFWMIEKTEEARPANKTAYFLTIRDDKRDKGATTIDVIRDAECDGGHERILFDRHVESWRREFSEQQGG